MTTTRYETCARCGKRQPFGKVLPLASRHPDGKPRQYKCRNEAACMIRMLRMRRK